MHVRVRVRVRVRRGGRRACRPQSSARALLHVQAAAGYRSWTPPRSQSLPEDSSPRAEEQNLAEQNTQTQGTGGITFYNNENQSTTVRVLTKHERNLKWLLSWCMGGKQSATGTQDVLPFYAWRRCQF